jgi:hypothetical protein
MQILSEPFVIFAFLGLCLGAALAFGLRYFKWGGWHYVDLFYYPLAAVGVVLLFAATSEQRKLLEITQLAEEQRTAVAALLSHRPNVHLNVSKELVEAGFTLVATIPTFADVCRSPTGLNARCSVAEKLREPILEFLKIARSSADQAVEVQLSLACPAADQMMLDFRTKNQLSSLIGDELIGQYKEAVAKDFPILSLDPLGQEINAFERKALARLNGIRSVLSDNSQASAWVDGMYRSEIEFGRVLLQGLHPCITSERKGIEALVNWTTTRQTEEARLAAAEADRAKLSTAGPQFRSLARIQMFIWPYVLILALAMKFGKGIASLKKDHVTQRPLASPAREAGQPTQSPAPIETPPEGTV